MLLLITNCVLQLYIPSIHLISFHCSVLRILVAATCMRCCLPLIGCLSFSFHSSHSDIPTLCVQGGGGGGVVHALMTQAEFECENGCKAPAGKRYFAHTALADIVAAYPMKSSLAVSCQDLMRPD